MSPPPEVLVVDDDRDVAELYARYLVDDYAISMAYNGKEALEKLDDDPDVVLLDRRMPDLSGDEVLTEIRDRDVDCRVGMVTAVEPDFNIVDMPFDDYVVKPVTAADLKRLVEGLIARKQYDEKVQEYFAIASKRAALVEEKPDSALSQSEEFQRLESRRQDLESDLDEIRDGLTDDDIFAILGDAHPDQDAGPGAAGVVDGR